MKKIVMSLIALTVVAAMAAPAVADYKFYGSVRMMTFWKTVDPPKGDSDSDLVWDLQSNSRFGLRAKTGDIAGRIEYGTGVNLRLLYATWSFDGGTLLLGQTYNPYTFFSDQAANADWGFLGYGALYDGRKPQIKISLNNGFYVSAITPTTSTLGIDEDSDGKTSPDVDTILPKLAAGYKFKVQNVKANVGAAFQTFDVKGENGVFDDTITSWLLYVNATTMVGPATLKATVHYGQNLGDFGLVFLNKSQKTAASAVVGTKSIWYTTSYGGFVQAGFKAADNVKVVAGLGYACFDNETYKDPDAEMSFFVQAPITIAKTFFVVPEFSYFDGMDDAAGNEESDTWYLGAKWQMNF